LQAKVAGALQIQAEGLDPWKKASSAAKISARSPLATHNSGPSALAYLFQATRFGSTRKSENTRAEVA